MKKTLGVVFLLTILVVSLSYFWLYEQPLYGFPDYYMLYGVRVELSPNGEYLAANNDGQNFFYLFSTSTNQPLWQQKFLPTWFEVSNSGLVTVQFPSELRVFENNGEKVWSYSFHENNWFKTLSVDNDGTHIAFACRGADRFNKDGS